MNVDNVLGATGSMYGAVNAEFGIGTYYAKADTSLPERAQRKWERRGGDGGGGE